MDGVETTALSIAAIHVGVSDLDVRLMEPPKGYIAKETSATPSTPCTLLLVDDEPGILSLLTSQLQRDYTILTACSSDQARTILGKSSVDIVLADLHIGKESGMQLLDWVQKHHPQTARVLISATTRVEDTVEAINRSRIHRLVLKPWHADDLRNMIESVAKSLHLERNHEQLLDEYRRLNLELEQRVQERTLELQTTLHQLELKNQILEKMALTDPLTSLPNRRAIELIARKELLRRSRTPSSIAFGLIDADHFKMINSQYLLSGGDHTLIWLGNTLHESIRVTDAMGRVGGEEFMVVAPATDHEGAEILAERLRSQVEAQQTQYNGRRIRVTVSVGFAVMPIGVVAGYEKLREAAAAALSKAKAMGRNRCIIDVLS